MCLACCCLRACCMQAVCLSWTGGGRGRLSMGRRRQTACWRTRRAWRRRSSRAPTASTSTSSRWRQLNSSSRGGGVLVRNWHPARGRLRGKRAGGGGAVAAGLQHLTPPARHCNPRTHSNSVELSRSRSALTLAAATTREGNRPRAAPIARAAAPAALIARLCPQSTVAAAGGRDLVEAVSAAAAGSCAGGCRCTAAP